jgi:D-inositol-3-phosphate glycosyltransferase
MKIDLVSEHASPLAGPGGPDTGGQNVHVRELSSALAAQGHEVTVWTRRDAAHLAPVVTTRSGVDVRYLDAGPARPLPKDELVNHVPAMAEALHEAWRHDPPDVAHAHFWMSGLATLSAAQGLHVPTVQTFHALGSVKRRHQGAADTSPAGRIGAERCIARQVGAVIATCSDEVFELARLGTPRRRVSVVPCGVDTHAFSPEGPHLLPRPARPRLLTLGRLVRRKGVDETVAALAAVPHAELVVAGGTGPRDADVARLRELAAARGVLDRVEFIGPVKRRDVPALLRSADAVVCVPWYEPFGMVPLEAMACGRPVMASAVGGHVDTMVDGVTGVLVPPRRPRELAAALRQLLGSSMIGAYGVAGRDRAVARYGWDRIAAATAEVYTRVARTSARPAQAVR